MLLMAVMYGPVETSLMKSQEAKSKYYFWGPSNISFLFVTGNLVFSGSFYDQWHCHEPNWKLWLMTLLFDFHSFINTLHFWLRLWVCMTQTPVKPADLIFLIWQKRTIKYKFCPGTNFNPLSYNNLMLHLLLLCLYRSCSLFQMVICGMCNWQSLILYWIIQAVWHLCDTSVTFLLEIDYKL